MKNEDLRVRIRLPKNPDGGWAHTAATEITDQDGRPIICTYPIVVEITERGAYATLRIPIDELQMDDLHGRCEAVIVSHTTIKQKGDS